MYHCDAVSSPCSVLTVASAVVDANYIKVSFICDNYFTFLSQYEWLHKWLSVSVNFAKSYLIQKILKICGFASQFD